MQKKLRNLGGSPYYSSTYHEVFNAAKELKPITIGKTSIVDYSDDDSINLLFTVRGKLLARVNTWNAEFNVRVCRGALEDTYERVMLEAFLRGVQKAMLETAQEVIEDKEEGKA